MSEQATAVPHLVRCMNPAWIEIGDEPDWQKMVCDGCGKGWDKPDDPAYFIHNVRGNQFYLRHAGCDDLLMRKFANLATFRPQTDRRKHV